MTGAEAPTTVDRKGISALARARRVTGRPAAGRCSAMTPPPPSSVRARRRARTLEGGGGVIALHRPAAGRPVTRRALARAEIPLRSTVVGASAPVIAISIEFHKGNIL